jgi:hypothetical protein
MSDRIDTAPTISLLPDGRLKLNLPDPVQLQYPVAPEVLRGLIDQHNELADEIDRLRELLRLAGVDWRPSPLKRSELASIPTRPEWGV